MPFDEEEEATTEKLEGFVEKYFEHREEENVPVQTVVSGFGAKTLIVHVL